MKYLSDFLKHDMLYDYFFKVNYHHQTLLFSLISFLKSAQHKMFSDQLKPDPIPVLQLPQMWAFDFQQEYPYPLPGVK